jgi:hypothetical protein
MIDELRNWLPNYDNKPNDYPTLLFRILASLPGGEELEDIGFEPFGIGFHEADQLQRVIAAIQDKRDVEELVAGLLRDENEERDVGERRRPPPMREQPSHTAHEMRQPMTRTLQVPVRPAGRRPVHRRAPPALPPVRRRR